MIIGSGNTYHNMQVMMRAIRGNNVSAPQGLEFDRWLSDAITSAVEVEEGKSYFWCTCG